MGVKGVRQGIVGERSQPSKVRAGDAGTGQGMNENKVRDQEKMVSTHDDAHLSHH